MNWTTSLLDSITYGPQLLSAAQGLAADASDVELATIATELPDYLTSRNQADTSWLDTALSVKVPALSDAITDARTKAKAAAITNYNFTQLTSRVNGGHADRLPAPTFVPLTAAS